MKRPNYRMLFSGLLSALWVLILFLHASADEAADNKGPILHLDAQQLNSKLSERNQKPLSDGEPVVMWPGGVGDGQVDFLGDSQAACPTFKRIGDHTVVRFDGVDDAMRCVPSWDSLKQCTLWLVVAPHENPGEFEGLLSTNAAGERDYVSGINVDLGPGPSRKFDFLNVEGKGFSGAQDLLDLEYPFATLHVIQVIVDSEAQRVSVFVDGRLAGNRPMQSDSISVQEWTLGARYYTNGPGAQQIRGPFRGDIAEVVVYDRVMSDAESITLHDALKSKYADLAAALPASIPQDVAWDPLTPFENPPSVQMLVPGFQVERIPVQLTNVNNVRYRPDGALVTLGYNGDIQILRDTDGDGLEDSATMFYKNTGSLRGPIGFEWTRPNDPRGPGCFVASKGKISFFADRNGDDVADGEQIVAQGWEEIPQNVDAVGLAIDSEGWVYFGLGTANYANAYMVDDKGQSQYDLKSDRGTIQRVSPDFTQRETVCTGIRFPIGLAFHASGDLFCTDQEGATWLPNGNPFDELLHIRSGKHYGFPPRHPKHNPSVIDEPSVFDYGPQHQSTCGMFFNASAEDSYHFGPSYWSGDAIVSGESRGKL
ncbi:MAG: hypothetical protein MUF23_07730, partial [Pirellula sp.]|nr:hypothetical protein [Pirellula sp.]